VSENERKEKENERRREKLARERTSMILKPDCVGAEVRPGVLQSIAVFCSVVQGGAVCCSGCIFNTEAGVCGGVLRCVVVCFGVFQYVVVCCSVLQYVAVCCSALQCVAMCCSVPPATPHPTDS